MFDSLASVNIAMFFFLIFKINFEKEMNCDGKVHMHSIYIHLFKHATKRTVGANYVFRH